MHAPRYPGHWGVENLAKILIIEDQRFISQIYGIVLKGAGHEVVTAADGATGLSLFSSETPDVVLTDIKLPDMCGLKVMQNIQGQRKVPVIVLTAGGSNEGGDYLVQARDLGAFEAFHKPVSSDQLIAAVDRALKLVA